VVAVHPARKWPGAALGALLVGVLAAGCVSAAAAEVPRIAAAPADPAITSAGRAALAALDAAYDPATGDRLITADGPWTAANELSTVVFADRVWHTDHTPEYAVLYAHYRWGSFQNDYYDDTAWWALAWIDAYREAHDQRYLTLAVNLAHFLQRGWTADCGGGTVWARPTIQGAAQKNSITNELDLQVFAELHTITGTAEWGGWADREWAWLDRSGLIGGNGLVADHLDAGCRPTGVIWSYTQGVVLTALQAYAQDAHRPGLLGLAQRLADASTRYRGLHPGGVLTEPCDLGHTCTGDSPLLKGCYTRDLATFSAADGDRYAPYLRRQARFLIDDDREPGDLYGEVWAGPPDGASTPRQLAAIDVLAGAALT
jgi:hypothetical protein